MNEKLGDAVVLFVCIVVLLYLLVNPQKGNTMPAPARVYVVTIEETKPNVRLISARTGAAAAGFVATDIIDVRLASQTDMYEAAKEGRTIEDSDRPSATPTP